MTFADNPTESGEIQEIAQMGDGSAPGEYS